jgi:hypothetical protein
MYQFLTEIMFKLCLEKKALCSQLFKLPSKELGNTERRNNALKQKKVHSFILTQVMDNFLVFVQCDYKICFSRSGGISKYKALNTKYYDSYVCVFTLIILHTNHM